MLNVEEKKGTRANAEVLLSFLRVTKEGTYAPIRESDLCFVRVKETTDNVSLEEDFYYGVR